MRILVTCQYYWPEPLNASFICEELASRGHDVVVVAGVPNYPEGVTYPDYRKRSGRRERHGGVEIIRVPQVARGRDLRGINKLRRALNYFTYAGSGSIATRKMGSGFDCVLIFQYSPVLMALPGIRYAERHRVPSLLYCYDLWPEDLLTGGMSKNGIPYKGMSLVSKSIYSRATKIAVTSPAFSEYFEDELGLRGIETAYLPQFAEDQFELIGAESHAEGSPLHVLFAGNIGRNQSVETIIRAAALLPDDLPLAIDVVGGGSHLEECKDLAIKTGADKVVFHGRRPFEEMDAYYRKADATLITLAKPRNDSLVSAYTIPRKLQSYLAIGKPVLSSAPGETAHIVRESRAGIAVEPESPEELARALTHLVEIGEESRREMGSNARGYYLAQFSKELFFTRLESQLEWMVDNQ